MFEKKGAYFIFTIDNKKINGVMAGVTLPYQPQNLAEVQRQITISRNKLPAWFAHFFKITEEEQKEYDNAKNDNDLKEIILKDAKKEGAKLIDIKIE